MSNHTKEPWYADKKGAIWRTNPSDLYENGGGIAGDKPLAILCEGWEENGFPANVNARRIVACVNACAGVDTDFLEAVVSAKKDGDARITLEIKTNRERELISSAKDMERRISEYEEVIKPILYYGHSRKDLPLGSGIIEEAIKAWKQRDDLLAALKYVMEDDGYIPRATSECRKVVAKAIASVERNV